MSRQKILLYVQIGGSCLAFIFSFTFLVPIVVHQSEFGGHCILFSNGTRDETGHLNVNWASSASCDYSIIVGALLLLVSAVQGYRMVIRLLRSDEGTFQSSFVDLLISSILALMVLAAAMIITTGFKFWCDTIISGYQSCAGASVHGIDQTDLGTLKSFYLQMGTAQFGAWISWVVWVALSVCTILRACWLHQQENLKVSMARERQRLLKSDDQDSRKTYDSSN